MYLAGPLDGLDIDGTAWYDEFAVLRPDRVVGFMPGRAYLGADRNPARVDEANRTVIAASDGVIANLSGPGRALGTIREIEFARGRRKTVWVIGDVGSHMASHDLELLPDVSAVAEALEAYLRR